MILPIPAIDIIEGQVVRLEKGDYRRVTVFHSSPEEVAKKWESEGAPFLHVVDLEGAKMGQPMNTSSIERIICTVSIPVEVGGGIRDRTVFEHYLSLGAERVVVGSVVVKNPKVFEEMLHIAPDRLAVSLDVRGEYLAIQGWTEETPLRAAPFARRLREKGVRYFIFTDIDQDGTLSGIRTEVIQKFLQESGVSILLAGGVSRREDIERLKEIPGVEGIILGKALYAGTLTLQEVITILRRE